MSPSLLELQSVDVSIAFSDSMRHLALGETSQQMSTILQLVSHLNRRGILTTRWIVFITVTICFANTWTWTCSTYTARITASRHNKWTRGRATATRKQTTSTAAYNTATAAAYIISQSALGLSDEENSKREHMGVFGTHRLEILSTVDKTRSRNL